MPNYWLFHILFKSTRYDRSFIAIESIYILEQRHSQILFFMSSSTDILNARKTKSGVGGTCGQLTHFESAGCDAQVQPTASSTTVEFTTITSLLYMNLRSKALPNLCKFSIPSKHLHPEFINNVFYQSSGSTPKPRIIP